MSEQLIEMEWNVSWKDAEPVSVFSLFWIDYAIAARIGSFSKLKNESFKCRRLKRIYSIARWKFDGMWRFSFNLNEKLDSITPTFFAFDRLHSDGKNFNSYKWLLISHLQHEVFARSNKLETENFHSIFRFPVRCTCFSFLGRPESSRQCRPTFPNLLQSAQTGQRCYEILFSLVKNISGVRATVGK